MTTAIGYIFPVYLIALGTLAGLYQGMVMTKMRDVRHLHEQIEGVRGHAWFLYYHRIWMLLVACVALAGAFLTRLPYSLPYNLILAGAAMASWQAFETAYSFTRYAKVFPEQENVFGTGTYIRNTELLTSIRILLAGWMVAIGLAIL